MPYQDTLSMLRNAFHKCHIQTLLLDPDSPLDERADMGLEHLLGKENAYGTSLTERIGRIRSRTVYFVGSPAGYRQLLMRLPSGQVLSIGPFTGRQADETLLWEYAERVGLPPRQVKLLEEYYLNLPYLPDQSHLYALLDAFAEQLWGVGNYTTAEIQQEDEPLLSPTHTPTEDADRVWNVQMMERRYAYENELMLAVTHGQMHKLELLLANLSDQPFERRLTDPVRNTKNYCIIMNTLMRKAAERGGVHPIHLDAASSDIARQIELLPSPSDAAALMADIFRRYCMLVRDHATGQYSDPVRRAIAYVEGDLSADLSLSTLARLQSINPTYLSSLFHREVGVTLTEFVNERRIRAAKHLLRSTALQVQTVAQYCGILDVNYFTKLFKKRTGLTPRQYREKA